MEKINVIITRVLAGEGTKEDNDLLAEWINQSPENSLYFQEYKKIWQNAGIKTEVFQPDVKTALHKLNLKIDEKETRRISKTSSLKKPYVLQYIYRVAAVLVLGLSLGFGYYLSQHSEPDVNIVSSIDQHEHLVLEDGTQVWLNANSRFSYPSNFENNRREVFLEGEAYFEVAKNPDQPFIVRTQNSVTKVLGTSFNVKALKGVEQIVVVVNSGKVAFAGQANEAELVLLEKGESGILDVRSGGLEKQLNEDLNFLSWKTGILAFNNTPLAEAVQIISQHYKQQIILDESLQNCRMTSTFENEPLEEVLEELRLIHNINMIKSEGKIILKGKGC